MAFLKRKTFFALVFVLFILTIFGSWFLPRLFFKTVASRRELKIEVIDYHSSLDLSFQSESKLDQLMGLFSDVVAGQDIKRLNVILSDVEQPNKINWMNSKHQLANHLGFDVQINNQTMDVYLYNNIHALGESGWDSAKIQREDELLLIRALLFARGIKGEKLETQIKEVYLSLQEQYKESLFNLTYAF